LAFKPAGLRWHRWFTFVIISFIFHNLVPADQAMMQQINFLANIAVRGLLTGGLGAMRLSVDGADAQIMLPSFFFYQPDRSYSRPRPLLFSIPATATQRMAQSVADLCAGAAVDIDADTGNPPGRWLGHPCRCRRHHHGLDLHGFRGQQFKKVC
jgi:hypothetical protein